MKGVGGSESTRIVTLQLKYTASRNCECCINRTPESPHPLLIAESLFEPTFTQQQEDSEPTGAPFDHCMHFCHIMIDALIRACSDNRIVFMSYQGKTKLEGRRPRASDSRISRKARGEAGLSSLEAAKTRSRLLVASDHGPCGRKERDHFCRMALRQDPSTSQAHAEFTTDTTDPTVG